MLMTRYLRKSLPVGALGVALGLLIAAPVAAEEDDTDAGGVVGGKRLLDIALSQSWVSPSNLRPCFDSCSRSAPVAASTGPDEAIYYGQDLSVDLGHSGPVSFRVSGRRLKMEFAF